MSRKEIMTWRALAKRWVKKHRGKQYAISCRQLGCEPTKEASRDAANEWWEKKLIQIAMQQPKQHSLPDPTRNFRRFLREEVQIDIPTFEGDDDPGVDRFNQAVERYVANIDQQPFELDVQAPMDQPLKLKFGDRIIRMPSESDLGKIRTIDAAIKVCLDRKEAQVHGGQRSAGRWDAYRCHLQRFAEWIGGGNPLELIDGSTLEGYHSHLLKEIGRRRQDSDDGLSPAYALSLFGAVKQFIRWAWGRGLVDLPRNIESKDFAFGGTIAKKITVLTIQEVSKRLHSATKPTKLYLLLILNCGMQQEDISDLLHEEIDLRAGTLTRKRSKTGKHEDVPVVTYKLWNGTRTLLKEFRSKHARLALTTDECRPLKTEAVVNGKLTKTDNIVSAYRRLERDQLKLGASACRPLKLFRKTSSSLLEKHKDFGKYAQYFLGHSPRTIADKHYVVPDEKQFFSALKWLGEQYGIT
jgi:integrase